MAEEPLLSVEDLHTHIRTGGGTIRAVDGVSFTLDRGETVCLVGESGSGKSVTCESLTGIVPRPPAEIVGGEVTFEGVSLTGADDSRLREIRGDRIAHVFQNPQGSLDPVYAVGEQIVEPMAIHRGVPEEAARERGIDLLRAVGIVDTVHGEGLGNRPGDCHPGVERVVGVLDDELCAPAERGPLLARQVRDASAVEANFAAGWLLQIERREGGRRLPTARLADDAERLSAAHLEGHAVDRSDPTDLLAEDTPGDRVVHLQIVDGEQGVPVVGRRVAGHGSSSAGVASPETTSRASASTGFGSRSGP